MLEPGYYDGEITNAFLETSGETEELILCFDVAIVDTDETVTCRHRTEGEFTYNGTVTKFATLAEDVCKHLEIGEWPRCLLKFEAAIGKSTSVQGKTKETGGKVYRNWYINTATGKRQSKPADPEVIKRKVKQLENAETPF